MILAASFLAVIGALIVIVLAVSLLSLGVRK